jgi:hypothetical protein
MTKKCKYFQVFLHERNDSPERIGTNRSGKVGTCPGRTNAVRRYGALRHSSVNASRPSDAFIRHLADFERLSAEFIHHIEGLRLCSGDVRHRSDDV